MRRLLQSLGRALAIALVVLVLALLSPVLVFMVDAPTPEEEWAAHKYF